MATDTPVNPLLVSANTSSTFDGFQSAAVLVPPRISEAVSNEEALEQSGSVPTLPDATAVGKTQTLGSQFQELYTGETAVAGAMHSLSLVSPGKPPQLKFTSSTTSPLVPPPIGPLVPSPSGPLVAPPTGPLVPPPTRPLVPPPTRPLVPPPIGPLGEAFKSGISAVGLQSAGPTTSPSFTSFPQPASFVSGMLGGSQNYSPVSMGSQVTDPPLGPLPSVGPLHSSTHSVGPTHITALRVGPPYSTTTLTQQPLATAILSPPSTIPTVVSTPSTTPRVIPPSSTTPRVIPPSSTTSLIGPLPSTTPLIGPLPSTTPLIGPPLSTTPLIRPPLSTTPLLPPPSTTTIVPPPSSTPSIVPPPSSTPSVVPPPSSTPSIVPPPSSTPSIVPSPFSTVASPLPTFGPPSVSPVDTPPSFVSYVGPPPSFVSPVGPPLSSISSVGPPPSSVSPVSLPPSSISPVGPSPSSVSPVGPLPSSVSPVVPLPVSEPSPVRPFPANLSESLPAAMLPISTSPARGSTASQIGGISGSVPFPMGPSTAGCIPLHLPPLDTRESSSLGPPPMGFSVPDQDFGDNNMKASSVDTGLSSVNLGEKFSEAASSPPPSTSPRASFVQSDNSSVIPPSFETMGGLTPKMLPRVTPEIPPRVTPEIPPRVTPEIPPQATNSVISGSVYHPVIYHWFYGVGRPQVWRPFSFADSFNLEEAFLQDSTELVPTEGGRYDVNVKERTRRAVYWEQDEPCPIRRCSWFKKSPLDAQPLPYDEQIAEQLESEYRDAFTSGQWHRQVDLKGGDRIMIHSPRAMIHYIGVAEEGEFPSAVSVHSSQSPLTVKRGTEDFEIDDGEAEKVDHLVFLIHGIGSVCDLRFRAVVECVNPGPSSRLVKTEETARRKVRANGVDDFRRLGQQLLSSHFKQSVDMGTVGRVEILPISWHKALHGDATGIDEKLKPITLRSIPKLREFTNDTILDVLLFNSPIYCQHIMDTVASEMNRLYSVFCERNPAFSGQVSLGGHSLGSVILFDLLMHQSPNSDDTLDSTLSSPKDDHDDCRKDRGDSITSPVDYLMGAAGTGQPSIVYPQISFKPEALFLMGSPIAMFITVRGIDTIGPDFQLPTCKRVFNIFHPFDPVAYRLETLIDPSLTEVRPVLVPHHKGRKRMHLELKETIERVGTEFKQKIVDSIQNTWNRLYQLYSGTPASQSLHQHVDEALADHLYPEEEEDGQPGSGGELKIPVGCLNQGRRIDYVLQEKPYESFNEYIFALQAHVTYWESEDTMLLMLKELYEPQGILCDAEINRKQIPSTSQLGLNGDPGLSSASLSPSTPPVSRASPPQLVPTDYSDTTSHLTEPVPLLSATMSSPVLPSVMLPPINSAPSGTLNEGPRVISGRPVVDVTLQQTVGMDPTLRPVDKPVVGPPPKIPGGTFVRTSPFRR
ncbi:SEC23-interacting protein isoform X4 [Cherax quadricarinatus]|uniref:SEC23-interacting protein isoform X4 n=1 Tax=Cherax quadricarinatus TaxID=27406 RepID=UPI00387E7A29